jgi:hypothetical protein
LYQLTDEIPQSDGIDDLGERCDLLLSEPASTDDRFDARVDDDWLELLGSSYEVCSLELPDPLVLPGELDISGPDPRTELEIIAANLLSELSEGCSLERLVRVSPAAWRDPERRAERRL